MAKYKINVQGLFFAEVLNDTPSELTHKEVQQVAELQEIQISPKIADGGLFGNGRKVHATSRKTSYEIAIDLTVLPPDIKAYMEGVKIKSGVEVGTSKDEPKAFACGFIVEKTDGAKQMIWYPYCKAKPVEEAIKQSEDNLHYSTDKLVVTVLEHPSINRFYTKIDSETQGVSEKMLEDFFKKVQTADAIAEV